MVAIRIDNVVKTYKETRALHGVSLTVDKGAFFGLLGPNGAGKTTLIHCITGLASITSGSIHVFGKDVERDYQQTREMIGLSQQDITMDPFFPIKDILMYQAGYFGIDPKTAGERAELLLKKFNLWEKKYQTYRKLSGGMKRKVEIAKALMHNPRILILDEPTAALDVETRRDLWGIIRELNQDGLTIVLTTHYIEEAQELCDTVAIMNEGKIVSLEKKVNLLEKYAEKTITAEYAKKPKKISGSKISGNNLTIEVSGKDSEDAVLKKLQKAGKIVSIETKKKSLEEVFLKLTEKKK